jgi:hypothetical protein
MMPLRAGNRAVLLHSAKHCSTREALFLPLALPIVVTQRRCTSIGLRWRVAVQFACMLRVLTVCSCANFVCACCLLLFIAAVTGS